MKEKKESKQVRSAYLDTTTIKQLEKEARQQRRTLSFIMADILNEWAKKIKN